MKRKNSKQFQENGDYHFAFKILGDVSVLQWTRKVVFECTWSISKVSVPMSRCLYPHFAPNSITACLKTCPYL